MHDRRIKVWPTAESRFGQQQNHSKIKVWPTAESQQNLGVADRIKVWHDSKTKVWPTAESQQN
jgi:hypothetical protein